MLTNCRVGTLSAELGVSVFAPAAQPEELASTFLLEGSVRAIFRQIDFSPVRHFFLNASEICIISEFIETSQCVAQVEHFRRLLLTVNQIDPYASEETKA